MAGPLTPPPVNGTAIKKELFFAASLLYHREHLLRLFIKHLHRSIDCVLEDLIHVLLFVPLHVKLPHHLLTLVHRELVVEAELEVPRHLHPVVGEVPLPLPSLEGHQLLLRVFKVQEFLKISK